MQPDRPRRTPEENARLTFELIEFGMKLMRQNLRRRHPDESEAQIDRRFAQWLQTRPGAEHGDAWGKPSVPDVEALLRRTRSG